ncbi:hypothetical protein AM593_04074, partial [Mytilus galloprovincialis]
MKPDIDAFEAIIRTTFGMTTTSRAFLEFIGFHHQTSRARVYPFHELLKLQKITHLINLRESKLTWTRRRVKSCISDPPMPAREIQPIRQFHRLDESKILPHVRKGLEFNDESEDI